MVRAAFVRVSIISLFVGASACRQFPAPKLTNDLERQGQQIFRDDTFGNEVFWTDTAQLHKLVENEIQPLEALSLGLKVDLDRLNIFKFLIHNPFGVGGTKELLRQNAVVGVRATVDKDGHITQIGITCAFCHSTVDNSFSPGIGHRLDGWPNRDLQVGKILSRLPGLPDSLRAVFRTWPKGTYDPRFNFDGKSTPLVLPPAYGLANIENETYTAEGPISYWNAYVAVTQMHGRGNFSDPRLGVNIVNTPDLVTDKLPALRAYQHTLQAPKPPGAYYNRGAAGRGKIVFDRNCASCHINGNGTDNNSVRTAGPTGAGIDQRGGVLHRPEETGMDPAYAERTTQKAYRTTPLRGLWQHAPYFHDGSAKTLDDVVAHYDRVRKLRLTGGQRRDLVEYLKSL
jgi:Cytochrome c